MPVLSREELTFVLNKTILPNLGEHWGLEEWCVSSLVHVAGLQHYNGSVSCTRRVDNLHIGHFFAFDEDTDYTRTFINAKRAIEYTAEMIINQYFLGHDILTCKDPECNC